MASSAAGSVIVGLGATGLATVLAVAGDSVPTSVAALAYVLAVTIAAAWRGLWSGITASVGSFFALNFFFTDPRLTFVVEKSEDVIALFVFLAVSGIVGTLLSSALRQRARAERRERQARLLHAVATGLLSGEPVSTVLRRFAEAFCDMLPLSRCEIATPLVAEPIVVIRSRAGARDETFPMTASAGDVGRITIRPVHDLGDGEREVVRAFAGQIALALERLRLAGEARAAHDDAEDSRLRAALFSSVTHDLRTPLSSITAAVSGLQDAEATFSLEDRATLLETIRSEAERLNRLVGNLLDLARMRAGALVPDLRPASIEEVIESVLARLQGVLAGRDVRLRIREETGEIPIDVLQIDQVLTNLVENACKYSPPASPITLTAARWHDAVEIRISDRGRGIPPEERGRVFEPFARGDDQEMAGVGLGLSIAQAIVVAHGGSMWIEATPGGGTTVAFRLPAAVPARSTG